MIDAAGAEGRPGGRHGYQQQASEARSQDFPDLCQGEQGLHERKPEHLDEVAPAALLVRDDQPSSRTAVGDGGSTSRQSWRGRVRPDDTSRASTGEQSMALLADRIDRATVGGRSAAWARSRKQEIGKRAHWRNFCRREDIHRPCRPTCGRSRSVYGYETVAAPRTASHEPDWSCQVWPSSPTSVGRPGAVEMVIA